MGLIGVARAGSFFAEHPDDDRLRIMAPHKSNLAEKPPSLSYRIVASEPHNTARVEWMGATTHDADSLAAGNMTPHEKSVLDEAVEFLRDELEDAPVMAKQVFKDARDAGVAEITLRRAKTALRVRSERQGTEGWAWRLPEDDHPPSGGGSRGRPEKDPERGVEGDQKPGGDRDDRDDHVDHLRYFGEGASPNPAYFREHDHDDQDDQGDHGDPREGDHDHVGRVTPRGEDPVRTLLDDPPPWLSGMLAKWRERPDAMTEPTCRAVAAHLFDAGVLDTPDRWREVVPVLMGEA
jgi:hypothetical protein